MPTFTPSFLDELRTRVSIVNIVGQSVKLKRKGNEYWGCCPFHHEKTASFSVSDQKEYYHCFGCGAHGNVIDFVMKTSGLSFPEAVEQLARTAGMAIPRSSPQEYEREKKKKDLYEAAEQACLFFEEQLYKPAGREALYYLQQRGLKENIIKQFRLGFAPPGNALKAHMTREGFTEEQLKTAGLLNVSSKDQSTYDYFRSRVMFPISDRRGRVIAFGGRVMDDGEPKYLNSPDTPLFSKGDNLYALHLSAEQARKMQEIIVVEGYMDVIAMAAAGVRRAVAPLGTALTERQIELLWRHAPEPLCCFDGDGAGQRAAARAADRVLPILKAGYSLRFVTLPDNLDPDEYIKAHGRASFENFLLTENRPLFKQLWQMLLEGRTLDTPERKAGLSKDIDECLKKIKDPPVQNFYRQEFKSALWEATNPYKDRERSAAVPYAGQKNKPFSAAARPRMAHPSLIPEREETRMMLAHLLVYPEFSSEFLEEISEWKPADEKQGEAINFLLSALAAEPDMDARQLEEHLKLAGKTDMYAMAAAEIEILRRRNPLPREIGDGLRQSLNGVKRKALMAEMKTLESQIIEASEEEARKLWERYQKLMAELTGIA